MRYQNLIFPALAGLAFAQDAANPAATPDALPVEDLRDIPVPTFTVVDGVMTQDIPYATADAVASVTSNLAETPLTVFPAATDVPINSAGESDDSSDDDNDDDASGNVITNTKNKRQARGVARQPHRRAACAAQATIPNFYNVALDSYQNFKADPSISSVAVAAATPTGYFQTVQNAPGANSAMNYLGYAVVNSGKTGYDVNWCAAKCDAKAGCFSFNIYFERDPVVEPGTGCTNPAAFANIKCSFWGTALDSKTANNYGQYRADFQVAVAGSNAYTSYKLGGPVAGWTNQALGNNVMQAPLWDCTNTWSYLGYKILQTGSVSPNLCATACDTQTAYNIANPPTDGSPVVKCNAFGSYILTKSNATGSYQQGQMCTMYTANWDKQFAVGTAAYDDSIGAKYTYSYSSFYGKNGVQPSCGAGFTSATGTFIKGGKDPRTVKGPEEA